MLVGTAAVSSLVRGVVTSWPSSPVALDDVVLLQAMFELRSPAGREAVLPPALHPTNPPTLVVQAWSCAAFSLAQVRVQCRSGLRPRGLVVGSVVSGDAPVSAWGFAPMAGSVGLRRSYDEVALSVSVGGAPVLSMVGRDPLPLDEGDVSWSSTLHLADTPSGVRLVQLDLDVAPTRVERVRPSLSAFDAAAWGNPLLDPWYPVSATVAVGRVTLLPVRFCCRPDVLAFEGTEAVTP